MKDKSHMAPNMMYFEATLTKDGIVRGFKRILLISIFFVAPFGIAFGAAAIEKGLTATQAIVMSFTVFGGASQFAVLDLWQAPIPYLQIALIVLVVNARHIILGAAISPWINALAPKNKFLSILLLSDINFADSYSAYRAGEKDAGLLFGGGLALWVIWVLGTIIGVLAGAAIGSMSRYGIDVIMMTFFAALTVKGLQNRYNFPPIIVASIVAILTIDILPSGMNIIVASLCGGVAGAFYYDK